MILCSKEERESKLFDYVQTMLDIQDDEDFRIVKYYLSPIGYKVEYEEYNGREWVLKEYILTSVDILLIKFSKNK